jgi:biopolymer transport protein ExbD
MAFRPNAPKRPVFEDLVDMTAMVDIVFFLLIFFMVTSMQGICSSIRMPSVDPQKAVTQAHRSVVDYEKDSDFIVVRIDRDNQIWLDGVEIPSEQELRQKLEAARAGDKAPKKMLVLGASEARHEKVVMVLDAGSGAGMDEMQLAVDDET